RRAVGRFPGGLHGRYPHVHLREVPVRQENLPASLGLGRTVDAYLAFAADLDWAAPSADLEAVVVAGAVLSAAKPRVTSSLALASRTSLSRRPSTTAMTRWLFFLAVTATENPAAAIYPVFSPSEPSIAANRLL